MHDSTFLHWDNEHARIKGFSTSNRGKATTVKIDLEVSDAYTLGRVLEQLQEAQATAGRKKVAATAQPARRAALSAPQRQLAAPLLALPAPRRGDR